MRNCDNCAHGSYGLNCNAGIETLYCKEVEYEFEVQQNHVCDSHKFIDGYQDEGLLGYDCDDNEINELLQKTNKTPVVIPLIIDMCEEEK